MADTYKASAVVLGASMVGLAAARAVANHFERVTIIDPDDLTAVSEVTGNRIASAPRRARRYTGRPRGTVAGRESSCRVALEQGASTQH